MNAHKLYYKLDCMDPTVNKNNWNIYWLSVLIVLTVIYFLRIKGFNFLLNNDFFNII